MILLATCPTLAVQSQTADLILEYSVCVYLYCCDLVYRCPRYGQLPPQCYLQKDASNPCCMKPECRFNPSVGQFTNAPTTAAPVPGQTPAPTPRPNPNNTPFPTPALPKGQNNRIYQYRPPPPPPWRKFLDSHMLSFLRVNDSLRIIESINIDTPHPPCLKVRILYTGKISPPFCLLVWGWILNWANWIVCKENWRVGEFKTGRISLRSL